MGSYEEEEKTVGNTLIILVTANCNQEKKFLGQNDGQEFISHGLHEIKQKTVSPWGFW